MKPNPQTINPQSGNILFMAMVVITFLVVSYYWIYPELYGGRPTIISGPPACVFCPGQSYGIYHYAWAGGITGQNLGSIRQHAADYCANMGRQQCVIMIWKTPDHIPQTFPVPPANMQAMAARYEANWQTGRQQICPVEDGQILTQKCF